MFTALGILICGIIAGRIFRAYIPIRLLHKAIMLAIFLLLFLLGVSIGSNDNLLCQLPNLGLDSLALMLFCVGGSIIASIIAGRFIHLSKKPGSQKK